MAGIGARIVEKSFFFCRLLLLLKPSCPPQVSSPYSSGLLYSVAFSPRWRCSIFLFLPPSSSLTSSAGFWLLPLVKCVPHGKASFTPPPVRAAYWLPPQIPRNRRGPAMPCSIQLNGTIILARCGLQECLHRIFGEAAANRRWSRQNGMPPTQGYRGLPIPPHSFRMILIFLRPQFPNITSNF